MVIAATNNKEVNGKVYRDAKSQKIIVNVADTPALCDFYLGGIVTKGNVKIAISTNGSSPTLAKRLRQFFEDVLPDEIDDLVMNLNAYRVTLGDGLKSKVKKLNTLTQELLNE